MGRYSMRRHNRKRKPKHTTRFLYRDRWCEIFTGEIVEIGGYSLQSKRKSWTKEWYSATIRYKKFKAVGGGGR